jgi:glyoxylase-like metal-dependent hydrolase (beta-lactamase superfamily II)
MKLNQIEINCLTDGLFRVDGGAMFGIVPKVLWNKKIESDSKNRIELGTNVLLIRTKKYRILIDTGIGRNYNEKFMEIYDIKGNTLEESLSVQNLSPEDIDYVILTHLHFDHTGNTTKDVGGRPLPTFKNAKYLLQKDELKAYYGRNEITKASYLEKQIEPIIKSNQFMFIEGHHKLTEGVDIFKTPGHTIGHQSVLIANKLFYPGDLIPTRFHLRPAYLMAYDTHPLDCLKKKKKFIEIGIERGWLFIFEHDSSPAFGRIEVEDGNLAFKEEFVEPDTFCFS